MGYVRRLMSYLTSRPYKSTHFPSRQIGISGPGHSCRGPVQLISDPAGARSSVHRCTHTIHTTPQAAPSACTLMFNHMRCRRAPRCASTVVRAPVRSAGPPRPRPPAGPRRGPQGRGRGTRGRLPAWPPEGPGVCKARVPAGRPALRPRSRIIEAHLWYFRSSVRGLRPCAW